MKKRKTKMTSKRINLKLAGITAFVAVTALSPILFSHCEIPCGIYGDKMRIEMMAEDITTVEKSMNKIHELTAKSEKNYNQIIRWVVNKGDHADKLSDTVTQYFMKQRIIPVEDNNSEKYDKYIKKITLLHKMMVYSMKCKQTTDLDNVEKLRKHLKEFKNSYFAQHSHSHH